jgi:hypothetical protein
VVGNVVKTRFIFILRVCFIVANIGHFHPWIIGAPNCLLRICQPSFSSNDQNPCGAYTLTDPQQGLCYLEWHQKVMVTSSVLVGNAGSNFTICEKAQKG